MITRQTILDLIDKTGNPSVSVYMPTHKMGKEVQQDPIRFKNLLKEVEQELSEQGMKEREIDSFLEEPRKLLDQPLFWQHADKGLAVFITEGMFEYFRVPLSFNERVLVEQQFLITPLLPMITLEGTYCMLTLSQKNIRLLRATRESVEPIPLEDSPTSMEEFEKFDEYEKSLSSASGPAGTKSMFHGWGDASIETKKVENYFKTIENEVTSIMRRLNDPLILAGVNEAVADYRKVNHYHRLLEPAVTTNPDPLSEEEIKDKGWEIIKSYFLEDMYHDIGRYSDLIGSDIQSDNLTRIVEASAYGKVDTLFVTIGEQSWGWYDPEEDVVHHSSQKQNGDNDLVNLSAIKTLSQGGDAYALRTDEMPQGSAIAAIFRYS